MQGGKYVGRDCLSVLTNRIMNVTAFVHQSNARASSMLARVASTNSQMQGAWSWRLLHSGLALQTKEARLLAHVGSDSMVLRQVHH